MTAPTHPAAPLPCVTRSVTCDAPGCTLTVLRDVDTWRRARGIPWPPDKHPRCAVSGDDPLFLYCPAHAFRYRGRTPTGQRWAAPRRPGCRLLRKGRPLRAYSADYRPCRCGAATDDLRKTWGVRWRIPDPQGPMLPGVCPACPGDLHVRAFDARCPACGYINFFGCPYPPS